jgi:hypothetical protein
MVAESLRISSSDGVASRGAMADPSHDAVVACDIAEHSCVDPMTLGRSCVAMNENNGRSLSLFDKANTDAVGVEEPFPRIAGL